MSTRIFLIVICGAFLLLNIFTGFNKIEVNGNKFSRYGSYGILNTEFISKEGELPKVFFLGNSVYYSTAVLKELGKIEKKGNTKFQIGNFGMPGASIYDYLFTYRHIAQFQPDLLVVQLNPVTFGYTWPKFRNDGNKGIFQLNQISHFRKSFIRELFDKDLLAESFFVSYFPLFRNTKLFSWELNSFLKKKTKQFTKLKLWSFFPNKLNLNGEWVRGQDLKDVREKEQKDVEFVHSTEYKSAEIAFHYLLEELKADSQEVIFIIQPSSYIPLPIMEKLNRKIQPYSNASIIDHSLFYTKALYVDDIHPNAKGAKKDAMRHYQLIKKALIKNDI